MSDEVLHKPQYFNYTPFPNPLANNIVYQWNVFEWGRYIDGLYRRNYCLKVHLIYFDIIGKEKNGTGFEKVSPQK